MASPGNMDPSRSAAGARVATHQGGSKGGACKSLNLFHSHHSLRLPWLIHHPPETLAWLRQTAKLEGATTAQVLLHLLERVEALEQRPIPGINELDAPAPEAAPVAMQRLVDAPMDARGYVDLRNPSPAAPAPEAAPVATDEELWSLFCSSLPTLPYSSAALRAIYNLGRQHGAAQSPAALHPHG
jgi:hypothetical protein